LVGSTPSISVKVHSAGQSLSRFLAKVRWRVDVFPDHLVDELLEADLGLPAQHIAGRSVIILRPGYCFGRSYRERAYALAGSAL
jgi:hypothetical protein